MAVNRVWQELFGRGLVKTSEDFGTQGEKPSHPELLDWLATEFVESGWSLKQLQKLIVTSATYRQSSAARPELETRDPENRLLARQNRLRLPAELVRDEALGAAGILDLAVGGPSVRPPIPPGVTDLSYEGQVKWPESKGRERYRRGLYIHFQRSVPYPQLVNFDAPDALVSCSRRRVSNTPLQALNLLNDPVFLEAAQGLAARILREAPAEFPKRLEYGFLLCLGRSPGPRERSRLEKYFEQQQETLRRDGAAAEAMFPMHWEGLEPPQAAAWVGLGRVLLNLDEFITRE